MKSALKVCAFVCIVATICCAQDILSVSSFQSCFSVSVNGAKLSCQQTAEIATILDLRVTPAEDPDTEAKFVVNLSTLPPDALSTQVLTGNKCQIATTDNKCQTTPNTVITVTATKPAFRYRLQPTEGTYSHPFVIPYAYYLINHDSVPTDIPADSSCVLTSTISTVTQGVSVSKQDIQNTFNNQTANNLYIKCGNRATVPTSGVAGTQTNAMENLFVCPEGESGDNTIYRDTVFFPILPQCNVYGIDNPPSVVTQVEVEVVNGVGTQTVTIDTVGTTAASSADGRVIARIEDVQSPSGNYGVDLPGLIIICTDPEDTEGTTINMSPPGQPIGTNPFDYRASINATYDKTNKYPTPDTIAELTGVNDQYAMWMFYNTTESAAVGEGCGMMGIDPNFYAHPSQILFNEAYFSTLERTDGSSQAFQIPYADIVSQQSYATCVQGFGFPYLDISVDTPCQAMDKFQRAEDNAADKTRDNLPYVYDAQSPNMWVDGQYLFYDVPRGDLSLEVVINFAGSFVGVGAKVPLGSINTAASACVVSMDPSACSTFGNGANSSECGISVQVCNPSTDGTVGNYFLSTTCRPGSNLEPLAAGAGLSVLNVRANRCVNVDVPLEAVVVPLPDEPICDVTLFSAEGSIDPATVVLQEVSFQCSVVSNFTAPPTSNIPSLMFAPGFNAPGPDETNPDTTDTLWIVAVVIGVILLLLLIMCIVYIALKCSTKNAK